ncbi:MAG: peptidylprolyl isomerase [Deltaproteobacteria bacterium]|nr:peptidylprolyl isomerase [Deltaproteobacteria bacterium]
MKKLLGLLVMSGAVTAALFLLTSLSGPGGGQPSQAITFKAGSQVQDGSIVSIEYTLTDESGKVIDTSVGKAPLTYIQGAGQIVKGLERELNGLKVGDQKKVSIKPEDGYGLPDAKAFQEIPREKIPTEAQKEGAMLMTKSPDGRSIPIKVAQVKEKTVVVDFNHPLAGKTLNFDVKIKDIKAAEAR